MPKKINRTKSPYDLDASLDVRPLPRRDKRPSDASPYTLSYETSLRAINRKRKEKC